MRTRLHDAPSLFFRPLLSVAVPPVNITHSCCTIYALPLIQVPHSTMLLLTIKILPVTLTDDHSERPDTAMLPFLLGRAPAAADDV